MARTTFELDREGFERLESVLKKYEGNAENIINEVLWNEGGEYIEEKITQLLPVSNKHWRGKKRAAKFAEPFMQEQDNLSVTVKTKNAYHYLYFPDDGTNTRKHVGEQYFMFGGATNAQEEIIERCIAKLTEIKGG
jgi:HK97 gp10 family phage protein